MGIALIMLYLPFYIVFSILGFVLCRNLLKGTESSAGEVIGFFVAVLAVVLTTILVWKFHSGEGDAGGLRKLQFLALSGLVAPFVVGIAGFLYLAPVHISQCLRRRGCSYALPVYPIARSALA